MSEYNISAKDLLLIETLYRDNYDKTTNALCALKMKAKIAMIPYWIEKMKKYFEESEDYTCERFIGGNNKSTLRAKKITTKKSITITFFPSTGSITIQGDTSELMDFEKQFEVIKRYQVDDTSQNGPQQRPNPAVPENILLAAADITIENIVTPLPTTPLAQGSAPPTSPPAGPSTRPELPKNPPATESVNPTPPPVSITSTSPPSDATSLARIKNLELEMINMDKRFTEQLAQIQKHVEDSARKPDQPTDVSLYNEALKKELGATKEQNNKLIEELCTVKAEKISHQNETEKQKVEILTLKNEIRVLKNKQQENSGSTQQEQRLGKHPTHIEQRAYHRPTEREQNEPLYERRQAPTEQRAYRSAQRSDTPGNKPLYQPTYTSRNGVHSNGRARTHNDQQPRHYIYADSETRGMIPREVGKNVVIKTVGGATIQDGIKHFTSNEMQHEPTESVTCHLGINSILKSRDANQNDLIDRLTEDYTELISAIKESQPRVREIFLSETFMLGDGKWSTQRRDAMNTTVDIMNDILHSIAVRDTMVTVIPHNRINKNTHLRRDGLHLDEEGMEQFTSDMARSLNNRYY